MLHGIQARAMKIDLKKQQKPPRIQKFMVWFLHCPEGKDCCECVDPSVSRHTHGGVKTSYRMPLRTNAPLTPAGCRQSLKVLTPAGQGESQSGGTCTAECTRKFSRSVAMVQSVARLSAVMSPAPVCSPGLWSVSAWIPSSSDSWNSCFMQTLRTQDSLSPKKKFLSLAFFSSHFLTLT